MNRELETANGRRNRTARGARGAAMSQTRILPSITTAQSRRTFPDALPILIEVPRIEPVHRKGRVLRAEPAYPPGWHRGMVNRRTGRRRRLRRHVRVSACALLGLAPLAVAACFAWSGGRVPAAPLSASASRNDELKRVCLFEPATESGFIERRRTASVDHDPVTLLSIEATSPAPGPEVEECVILPGYLLPDNSREEPVHEGS